MMHEAKVAALYEKGSEKRLQLKRHPYNNIGYWQEQPKDLDDAAPLMLKELVRRGGLEGADMVLDAGCGYGQGSVDLRRVYGCKKVIGIDISERLVEFARRVAEEAGVADAVSFQQMSATELGFEPETFSHVIAVDCACHFNPRDSFFKEAHRVLRPGGTLVISDGIPAKLPQGPIKKRVAHKLLDMWCIPRENVYSLEGYRSHLEQAGFVDIGAESVVDRVLLPAIDYITSPEFEAQYRKLFGRLKTAMTMGVYKQMYRACENGYLDYGFLTARKA